MNRNLSNQLENLYKQMNEAPTNPEKLAIFEEVMQFLIGAGAGFLNYQIMRNAIKKKLQEILPNIPVENQNYRRLHNALQSKLINYL